jgi:hypothetical protein
VPADHCGFANYGIRGTSGYPETRSIRKSLESKRPRKPSLAPPPTLESGRVESFPWQMASSHGIDRGKEPGAVLRRDRGRAASHGATLP